MESKYTENIMMKISIWGSVTVAIIGFIWGVITNSQMIFFDGMYSLVGFGLSSISLLAVNFMNDKQENVKFQFGKDTIEPLVVIFKSFVIFVLCIYAIITSSQDIFTEGRKVDVENALVYAIFSTAVCIFVYLYLKRKAKNCYSELLKAEYDQWFMDTLLSTMVLLGFCIATILKRTSYYFIIPYVDPLLVLVAAIYFIKNPISTLKKSIQELLRMAPNQEIQGHVRNIIEDIESKYHINESYIRICKVGSTVFIEIDFILTDESRVKSIKESDAIREEIYENLKIIQHQKWLTVCFTENRKWAI